MAYAILRTAKLKEMGHIAGSLAHTFRTRETPNADPDRLALNEHHGPETPEAILDAIKDRLPDKVRKNGVRCIEYFIGGSPEHFKHSDGAGYFEDARKWLIERHGAENVISTHVHRDETTPHMVAYVVPITVDGKLSARHFLAGPEAMRELQTEFAEKVGKPHGLERGREGSKATHKTIAEYYAEVGQSLKNERHLDIPTERRLSEKEGREGQPESDDEFARRVAFDTVRQLRPLMDAGLRERGLADEVKHLSAEVTGLRKALKPLEPIQKALSAIPEHMRGQVFAGAMEQARQAAERVAKGFEKVRGVVLGMTKRAGGEPGPDQLVIERDDNRQKMRLNDQQTDDLKRAGVKVGDRVEVSQIESRIIQRGPDQAQDRGRTR